VRDATFYARSLLDLDKLTEAAERRACWRQAMAALARSTAEDGPGALEGLAPSALLSAVRVALRAGLADDLDWLAPAAAGAALYELAWALPLGPEQRELGRRVVARLLRADAETFVAIARRMARAGRGLATSGMRARVVLVTELPLSMGVADGSLALALASRRDLAREWIGASSTGSLPSRRLAARLLERAAREASSRAAGGDEHSLRAFTSDVVAPAWERLLADRESLVWRHVAVARGLLAPWVPALEAKIEADVLDASLSPTEWRRGAASMAARIAVAPDRAVVFAKRALAGGLLERDPGARPAILWGLARAAEAEPEAAGALLDAALASASPEVGEAVLDLREELGEGPLVQRAAARVLALSSAWHKSTGTDDGAKALALEVVKDLQPEGREDGSVRAFLASALHAFATSGAKEAFAAAKSALSVARGSVDALDAVSREDTEEGRAGSIARRTTLAVLRDLDLGLLEHDVLAHLLSLGSLGEGDGARGVEDPLDRLRDRLAAWILAREAPPNELSTPAEPAHPTLSLRRLRALLHLADSDMGDEDADPARAAELRKRVRGIARVLLERIERGSAVAVRRTILAALARALSAMVRVGSCDPVDALLVVIAGDIEPASLATLAEASIDPDLVHVFAQYARFAEAVAADPAGALPAFEALTTDLSLDASSRSEALRTVLLRLGNALGSIASATSLRALAASDGAEPEAIVDLETELARLSQMGTGARARFDPERTPPGVANAIHPLSVVVAGVLSGKESALEDATVLAAIEPILAGVPHAIAALVAAVVRRTLALPLHGAHEGRAAGSRSSVRVAEALPSWVPPRRVLGDFYVQRALSAGAAGSVFVATRLADRNDSAAPRYALKVPEYSASAARSLAEAEFLKMFQEEAAALMALPVHPNIARFVMFDPACRPKPILVMELVEGQTLERILATQGLDAPRAIHYLDGVLRGLEAMHGVGIGHLDVKPSNVVLRRGEQAVLVDFGLAGHRIRRGCGSGPYSSPEVWGTRSGEEPPPALADVYSFGCVAFETLTGHVLFDGPTEMAQIAMHVAHDGFPPPLRAIARKSNLAPLAELLFATLRRDPRDRPAAARVRKELAALAPAILRAGWPLGGR
jgi:hypothetical protein